MRAQSNGLHTAASATRCSMHSLSGVHRQSAAHVLRLLRTPSAFVEPAVARTNMSTATWEGTGMTQQDFMARDECLIVDASDALVGTASKHACHRFLPEQPQGILHRAFSVFLFNPDGKLLLQQRAASKVTFPSVWTNTCCSHPLAGQTPCEIDLPAAIVDGSVPGVKAAAVRKLAHELGIPSEQVPPASFTFLTRLHYCAADTDTHGPNAEWGEHEVDYILFVRPAQSVTLAANPDEVDAVRWVGPAELAEMMDPASGLRWSPWFRILAERFLGNWWRDLDATLAGSKHADFDTIHHVL